MKRLKFIGAVAAAAAILLRPEAAVSGAQRAMALWCGSVAPSLFPFLVFMPVLTGPEACTVYKLLFSGVMEPVFHLPGQAAPAIIIGMISGSPGGALGVRQIAGQSRMRRGEARRIALAVSGVSPAYLIMGVGMGLYGSAHTGMRLAAVQAAVQLGMLLLLRNSFREDDGFVPELPDSPQDRPVRRAVENVLVICGYMVFFSALASVVSGLLGKRLGTVLLLGMDLPSGLAALSEQTAQPPGFVVGAAVGFAGVCIGMQNMDVLADIGITAGDYFAAKIISASAMGCVCRSLQMDNHVSKEFLKNALPGCSFSMLIAGFLAIPVLIYFSKKYFLNRGKLETKL